MHDIGKIGIPDSILLKEGPLTPEEDGVMKTHPRIGYDILKGSPSKYLSMGAIIALGHHEKFDGSGYPNGLHGEDIPIVGRVVAVADVFDALVSERPYKHDSGIRVKTQIQLFELRQRQIPDFSAYIARLGKCIHYVAP